MKTKLKRLAFALMVLAISVNVGPLSAQLNAQEHPDTILFNGKVVTVDDFFSIQEAIAIDGEQITAVGSNEQIQALAGPDTLSVDLAGRTVIPGLI
ncbi:MAG: amidohydrolase, partial [Proteobacteria bacterium]|nr:amidohydrolase [Pseudomonadota bacterium]